METAAHHRCLFFFLLLGQLVYGSTAITYRIDDVPSTGVLTVAECLYPVPWEIPVLPLSGSGCTLTLPDCLTGGRDLTLSLYYEPPLVADLVYTPFLYWRKNSLMVAAGVQYLPDLHSVALWVNDDVVVLAPVSSQYVIRIEDQGRTWTMNNVTGHRASREETSNNDDDLLYECVLGTPTGDALLWLAAVAYTPDDDWYTGARLLTLVKDVSICPLRSHRWLPFADDRWAINATQVQLFLTDWDNVRCRTPPWMGPVFSQ